MEVYSERREEREARKSQGRTPPALAVQEMVIWMLNFWAPILGAPALAVQEMVVWMLISGRLFPDTPQLSNRIVSLPQLARP